MLDAKFEILYITLYAEILIFDYFKKQISNPKHKQRKFTLFKGKDN